MTQTFEEQSRCVRCQKIIYSSALVGDFYLCDTCRAEKGKITYEEKERHFNECFSSMRFLCMSTKDADGDVEPCVMCEQVERHCLDKQKVRDAIENLPYGIVKEDGVWDVQGMKNAMKERLGL